MINWYIALLNDSGQPRVTLPNREWGTKVASDGSIYGILGAAEIWNGPPPPWCVEIVEVRSPHGWPEVAPEEKTTLWKRS